jgi:V/A-type H+-transporting ATPase subunit G/H
LKEILEDVKATEQKAREIVEQAEQEAKTIIAAARKEEEVLIQEAKKRGEDERVKIIEKARAEAEAEAEHLKEEYLKSIEQLRQKAAGRIKTAVDLIAERTVKAHGDS